LYYAESGSLSLCSSNFLWLPSDPAVSQQRPCHSDYLPLSRADTGFFQPVGFASFAGQTKKPLNKRLFIQSSSGTTCTFSLPK
ncbi:hypothetical protein JQC92_13415, partial [Shewanella sp. 202IG2-18]|uniref:hypothetical protein n=1 Tax=Parashewanella hymeniacidonis TaxID=2807618 RepID=UPI001962249E